MHFTVIIEGRGDENWSYGLVLAPSAIWLKQGSGDPSLSDGLPHGDALGTPANCLKVIEPLSPHLEPGSVQQLLDHEPGLALAIRERNRAVIVTHNGGLASEQDLEVLNRDLESHGLDVAIFRNHSDDPVDHMA